MDVNLYIDGDNSFGLDAGLVNVATDATLSIPGVAADAAATGEAISAMRDGSVANADQLLSDQYTLDTEPYTYRKSFSGDREIDEIVGGTLAWNQLLNKANYPATQTSNNVTFTNNGDGSVTISTSGSASANTTYELPQPTYINGHVYAILPQFSSVGSASTFELMIVTFTSANLNVYDGKVAKYTAATNQRQTRLVVRSGATISSLKAIPQIIDLTQMFGSAIADYILTVEQSTTGAGVALAKKWANITKPYYAYNAGELISVSGLTAHVMCDADDNVIAEYPLDSSLTLRGVPKLVNNKMAYDGDVYKADGTVERKYGVMVLSGASDEDWVDYSSSNGFALKVKTGYSVKVQTYGDGLCDKLPTLQNMNSLGIVFGVNSRYIFLPQVQTAWGVSTVAELRTYLASHNLTVLYVLDPPTTESATPYQSLQIVDENGTEAYTSTATIPIPVGHSTKYLENLRKKIEGLPWDLSMIAPIENGSTASQAYSTGQYFLRNNVFCKAKTSIASGASFTLNTNYQETTVAAELYTALH